MNISSKTVVCTKQNCLFFCTLASFLILSSQSLDWDRGGGFHLSVVPTPTLAFFWMMQGVQETSAYPTWLPLSGLPLSLHHWWGLFPVPVSSLFLLAGNLFSMRENWFSLHISSQDPLSIPYVYTWKPVPTGVRKLVNEVKPLPFQVTKLTSCPWMLTRKKNQGTPPPLLL